MGDLTAAYCTVWHQDMALKLLRTILDRHLLRFIMKILSNRSFKSRPVRKKLVDYACSRMVYRKAQHYHLSCSTSFGISDIPTAVFQQYGYADDMALLYSHKGWQKVKQTLSRDMEDLTDFLQTRRFKLNTTKTTFTPFRLNNHGAQRQLNICIHGTTLPLSPHPKYLGVKLDRQLAY